MTAGTDTADLGRDGALASFAFALRDPRQRLAPVFGVDAPGPVAERALVCTAVPCRADGSPVQVPGSWKFSERLRAVFAYFPAFEGRGLVRLRPFELEEPFDFLVLSVRPWRRSDALGGLRVRACLELDEIEVGGATVPVYRAASPFPPVLGLEDLATPPRPAAEAPERDRIWVRPASVLLSRADEERLDRLGSGAGLRERIEAGGYRSQAELAGGRPTDELAVTIGADGRQTLANGLQRLVIARELGLERIPALVNRRDPEWEGFRADVLDYAARHRGVVYQQIDHPDLEQIPATHATDRIDMLRAALAGHRTQGRRLLDIGTHWGYMCQQMEKLGFTCTAVELSTANARFARRLRDATGSSFEVWQGSVFDFPQPEEQEVVLALNIFHHFLKTEELHAQLEQFLARLRAEVILFEPHRHDPPGQMAGAYRNYGPDEFVDFVMRHSGMTDSEPLGVARDGRPLYKLWRAP